MAVTLCWTTLMLVAAASTVTVSNTVDPVTLHSVVTGIRSKYGVKGMYSLAVRIPETQNHNTNEILGPVLRSDNPENVKNRMNSGAVYVGDRVVAAKVKKPDHAESRVLDHLNTLIRNRDNNRPDWLLFYVHASPCDGICTNSKHAKNILGRIEKITKWSKRAFVFRKIFQPQTGSPIPPEKHEKSLWQLGQKISLGTIFRCDGGRCVRCFNGNQVNKFCISDDTNINSDVTGCGRRVKRAIGRNIRSNSDRCLVSTRHRPGHGNGISSGGPSKSGADESAAPSQMGQGSDRGNGLISAGSPLMMENGVGGGRARRTKGRRAGGRKSGNRGKEMGVSNGKGGQGTGRVRGGRGRSRKGRGKVRGGRSQKGRGKVKRK